jgi:arsenite methyltransferase
MESKKIEKISLKMNYNKIALNFIQLELAGNYMTNIEFEGLRSSYYKTIIEELPNSRDEEKQLCLDYLKPQAGENILETGAGGGFFTQSIAQSIFPGKILATDPSPEQLEGIIKKPNIEIFPVGADVLPVGTSPFRINSFDAVWSGASFHHVTNKTLAFKNFYNLLKSGGRLVVADVFTGSNLAKHFDLEVAKYCLTGHEVSFLSKEYADSICFLSGFETPNFYDTVLQWKFGTKEELGKFLYNLHAMVKTTLEECYKKAEEILGIEYKNGHYCLNWPLTVLVTYKK